MNKLNLKLTRQELNEYKNNLKLTEEQLDVLIGGLLGDLNLRKIGKYSRLVIEQKNKEYLFHLYEVFKNFIRTEPKERLQKRLPTSEWKSTWYFSTISHSDFEKYYQIFYINIIKIIPLDILNVLTPRALAYWYMDNSSKGASGYLLHTCSSTVNEHKFLKEIFHKKWNINIITHEKIKYNYIYIGATDGNAIKFEELIKPLYYRKNEI